MLKPVVNGTKILVYGSYECWLPPLPDKSQIINHGLPRSEQFWKRQSLPNNFKDRFDEELGRRDEEKLLVKRGDREKVTFVDPVLERFRRQEFFRRQHGVWFFNDGQPTYITGHNYFYLQWCKFDHPENDGYPIYYEYSRDTFYFRQHCEEDDLCLGYLVIGPRGTGKSSEEIACIVNNATRKHNCRAFYQSKSLDDDSKGVLFQAKTVPLFNNLPQIFKPEYSHSTNPKDTMIFTRRAVIGSESKKMQFGDEYELNSFIMAVGPGEKVLDGETVSEALIDEIGKTSAKEVADVHKRHRVNLKSVFRNHRKRGMLRCTSTVEEMIEGGDECYAIWKESDPKQRDKNGQTISKIYRYFISALTTDTSPECCDKFGRVNKEGANQKIENSLEMLKHDYKQLSSEMRKNPRNEAEAFIKDQSKSIFNIMKCTTRINHIRNEMKKKPYVKGNLYWLDKKFGPVWWAPDEHAGRFNMAWMPDEFKDIREPSKAKILNNVTREWGYNINGKSMEMLTPHNYHLYRIATDPIKYTRTKDPRASKAAIHAFRLYDHLVDGGKKEQDWLSHNFFFEYCVRPEDPTIYLEDLAMLAIFLGTKVLPERNIPDVNEYFERNGLENLLFYPNRVLIGDGPALQEKSNDAGLASSAPVIDYYTKRLIPFINKHVHRMPFDDTIDDWMNFDSTNPTKSHLTVSSGFSLVHAEVIAEDESKTEGSVSDWFDRYDNSEITGTLANEFVELPK